MPYSQCHRCSPDYKVASLAEAADVGLTDRSARDALAVITAAYEYFGNFRLRTLRSA